MHGGAACMDEDACIVCDHNHIGDRLIDSWSWSKYILEKSCSLHSVKLTQVSFEFLELSSVGNPSGPGPAVVRLKNGMEQHAHDMRTPL